MAPRTVVKSSAVYGADVTSPRRIESSTDVLQCGANTHGAESGVVLFCLSATTTIYTKNDRSSALACFSVTQEAPSSRYSMG